MSLELVIRIREGGPEPAVPTRRWPPPPPPFRFSMRLGAIGFVHHVLTQAGALATLDVPAEAQSGAVGAVASWPRGANSEVASFKLGSSDAWPLSPDECRILGERLDRWLETNDVVEFGGTRLDLRSKNDRETRVFLEDLARFFLLASQHDGAVVS